MTRTAAVFLDRDGVLNEAFLSGNTEGSGTATGTSIPPRTVDQFRLLPGVVEACDAFRQAGLTLVVVTNQPDIARGSLRATDLAEIHGKLRGELPVDEICVCPHDDVEGCPCRKPRPGMILDAARRLNIDLNRSVGVGDRWRDVEAARRAGVHSVYIEWNHNEELHAPADATFGSLIEAKDHILAVTTGAGNGARTAKETNP